MVLAGWLESLAQAAGGADELDWKPLLAAPLFRTGFLLLRAERERSKERSPESLRQAFLRMGVALMAYDGGMIPLSLPSESWQSGDIEHLGATLAAIALSRGDWPDSGEGTPLLSVYPFSPPRAWPVDISWFWSHAA